MFSPQIQMCCGRLMEFSLPRHILILAGTFDVYEVNTPGTRVVVDPGFRDRKLAGKKNRKNAWKFTLFVKQN